MDPTFRSFGSLPSAARAFRSHLADIEARTQVLRRDASKSADDARRVEEAQRLIAEAEALFRRAGELLKRLEELLPDDSKPPEDGK